MFYLSFFLMQTFGIFAAGIWINGRAVWAHFKEWQSLRRQQQLVQLRDEVSVPFRVQVLDLPVH